jgi:hypothetical protein
MRKAFLAFLIFTAIIHFEKADAMEKVWFENTDCSKLTLHLSKLSNEKANTTIEINDTEAIAKLIKRIQSIPANGDEMISMIVDETIELHFQCGTKVKVIEVQNRMFKTPSTGFNSDRTVEKVIYDDLINLLHPTLDKKILKIKNLDVKFPDFTMTFLEKTSFSHEMVTVSGQTDHFRFQDKTGKIQKIDVSSGQISPAPQIIEVGKEKFILKTFLRGESLYPDYFMISK